ncbi:YtzC family protein [Niallia nealsonii]|uniref:DUF2524 domain-containing protein n=1 Tax=Niallia nealsonii TaxID=115979 RepID=A0A2N0YYC2_9BACI|nr:YtzC family protein [Niallia nealsonii]PKG22252.1 DUF2524 domain-containing protein [Niallia nealsonii]
MATRQSVNELIERCTDVLNNAQEQCKESSLQEHYNNEQYIEAQVDLEQVYNDLHTMDHSANQQQREQLHRMRLQIEQMQNKMTLQSH